MGVYHLYANVTKREFIDSFYLKSGAYDYVDNPPVRKMMVLFDEGQWSSTDEIIAVTDSGYWAPVIIDVSTNRPGVAVNDDYIDDNVQPRANDLWVVVGTFARSTMDPLRNYESIHDTFNRLVTGAEDDET